MPDRGRGYEPIQLREPDADRLQVALATFLAQLEERVAAVESPAVLLATKSERVGAQVVVDYRGPGGHTITLPLAASAGKGKARFVHILNNGAELLTVAAAGKDTIQGAKTFEVAAATAAMLSGHETRWSPVSGEEVELPLPELYSPALSADFFGPSSVVTGNGSITSGNKFTCTRPMLCTGIRFYWKDPTGGPYTVRCRLWANSTPVASVDVTVSASGLYTGTFATPVTVDPYQGYAATVWDISGAHWSAVITSAVGPNGAIPIVGMIPIAPYTIGRSFARFAAGNAVPGSTSGSEMYPVEPLLEVPES